MWDGLSSGGVGMTGPVFRHFGPAGDAMAGLGDFTEPQKAFIANASIIGGSVIGGLFGYGLFGHLRDKGWGPWEAGGMVGLLGGLSALAMIHGVGLLTGKRFIGRVQ